MNKVNRNFVQAKQEELKANMAGIPYDWMLVTLGSKSGASHKYPDIVQALKDSNLDEKAAREFLPKQAFHRACKTLAKERVIDALKEEGDRITFQLTQRLKREHKWKYEEEAMLSLDTKTGQIECSIPQLKEFAQKELDRCMEERTTNDVTRITVRLFEVNAEILPVPGSIATYIVPRSYVPFIEKVTDFLARLGRQPWSLPIPSGIGSGERMIQSTIKETMEEIIRSHDEAIEGFSPSTRQDTLDSQVERINNTRVKIQAYATYLQDQSQALLDAVSEKQMKLLEKIDSISERKEEIHSSGEPVRKSLLGHATTSVLRWMGLQGWSFNQAKKVLDKNSIQCADSTVRSQLYAGRKGQKHAELSEPDIQVLESQRDEEE